MGAKSWICCVFLLYRFVLHAFCTKIAASLGRKNVSEEVSWDLFIFDCLSKLSNWLIEGECCAYGIKNKYNPDWHTQIPSNTRVDLTRHSQCSLQTSKTGLSKCSLQCIFGVYVCEWVKWHVPIQPGINHPFVFGINIYSKKAINTR